MAELPRLIVVTGAAGSGKTTLAHLLAREVGCPALCRDELKEGMVATYGPGFVAEPSDPLTVRTFALFFSTIESWLRAGVTLVAEAAFQHRLWASSLEPLLPLATLRVVRCRVDPDENRRRMLRRLEDQPTRRAHADQAHLADQTPFVPLALPVPTLDLDTTNGYRPGLTEVTAFVRS